MVTDGNCAPYYVEMSPVAQRCVPSVISRALNFTFQNAANTFLAVVSTSDVILKNLAAVFVSDDVVIKINCSSC